MVYLFVLTILSQTKESVYFSASRLWFYRKKSFHGCITNTEARQQDNLHFQGSSSHAGRRNLAHQEAVVAISRNSPWKSNAMLCDEWWSNGWLFAASGSVYICIKARSWVFHSFQSAVEQGKCLYLTLLFSAEARRPWSRVMKRQYIAQFVIWPVDRLKRNTQSPALACRRASFHKCSLTLSPKEN